MELQNLSYEEIERRGKEFIKVYEDTEELFSIREQTKGKMMMLGELKALLKREDKEHKEE